jgi:hypothetical protein
MLLLLAQRLLSYVVLKVLAFRNRGPKAALIASAQEIVKRRFGAGSRIEARGDAVRGATYPCRLSGVPGGSPQDVFLKRGKPSAGSSFDPADADPESPAFRLFNDWAGLQFLETLAAGAPLAPRFLAGDSALGFFIVEDAGKLSLLDLVLGGDAGSAERGLTDLGRLVGRLQAASFGKKEQYEAIRFGLGPRADPEKVWGKGPWFRTMVGKLRRNLGNVSFEAPEAFYRDLEGVIAAIDDPGPFQVFTHHDLGPENLLYSLESPRLIDFEFGDFRHALTDGAYVRMLFPTMWRVERVPKEIVVKSEAEYRAALAVGCPAALDDDLFGRALLDGCAYWLTVTLAFAFEPPVNRSDRKSAVQRDPRWGPTTLRQIVLGRLDSFLDAAEGAPTHVAMRETCLRLKAHLLILWNRSEAPIPYFPAFKSYEP